MSSASFAPLVTLNDIITHQGTYKTRCGEVVTITSVSAKHDFGCVGTYSDNITTERWHKSGYINAGGKSANDIVQIVCQSED